MKLTETQLQQLAAQLRCPDADAGIMVADNMEMTNANIINKAFDALALTQNDTVLEIGPGNGNHIVNLPKTIEYTGADISEAMVALANQTFSGQENITFVLTDGATLPFKDSSFTKAVTVNTIYFWENPQQYAAEIARVLQPGGILAVGFIPQSTMQHIPFAQYGFTHYSPQQVSDVLESAGFKILNTNASTEFVTSNSGEQIEREICVITAQKP